MPKTPLASRPHDHSHCVHTALSEADTLCTQKGLRLTALRRRVLELVWQSHKPLGAYDILGVLSEQDGRRAAPPTVYRALDFLMANGFVHKLESVNAFVACHHPSSAQHSVPFLICRECHAAIELEQKSISDAIIKSAGDVGFRVEGQTVEVVGICSGCQGA